MKWVKVNENNRIAEIIPEAACMPSIAHWYGDAFAAQCREAPAEVECGWVYDPEAQTFSAPDADPPAPVDEVTLLKAQVSALTQSNQMLEDCLVEMAGIVYA